MTAHARIKDLEEEHDKVGTQAFAAKYPSACILAVGFINKQVSGLHEGRTSVMRVQTAELRNLHEQHSIVGRVYFLDATRSRFGKITVGRGSANDIVIPDFPISKEHCYFRLEAGQSLVVDLASTNGTFVNNKRIAAQEPTLLADGCRLVLGRFGFIFHSSVGALVAGMPTYHRRGEF